MGCAPKCTTLGVIVQRAAQLLADNDPAAPNTRWPVSTLVSFINEGLHEIASRAPGALASLVELHLKPGAIQTLPKDYTALVSIDEFVNGRTVRPVSEVSYQYRGRVKVPARKCSPCATSRCADYFVSSYTKHPIDDRTFWVDPPVPTGCPVSVRAVVALGAVSLDGCNMNACLGLRPEFEAQLLDWVMWRALSMDHVSEGARAQAKVHYETFVKGLADKKPVSVVAQTVAAAAAAGTSIGAAGNGGGK